MAATPSPRCRPPSLDAVLRRYSFGTGRAATADREPQGNGDGHPRDATPASSRSSTSRNPARTASSDSAATPVDAVRQPVCRAMPRAIASPGRLKCPLDREAERNGSQVGGQHEHPLARRDVGPPGRHARARQFRGERLEDVLGAEGEDVVEPCRQPGDQALVDIAARREARGEGARHLGRCGEPTWTPRSLCGGVVAGRLIDRGSSGCAPALTCLRLMHPDGIRAPTAAALPGSLRDHDRPLRVRSARHRGLPE